MSDSTYDTVVVGGGLSGIVCALLQARKGQRVALVERAPHLSPTLWGFVRKGTYFDTGFHYAGSVGQDGLLMHLLRSLGMEEAFNTDQTTTEIYDRVRFQQTGLEVPFAQGWEALEAGLGNIFPNERQEISDFLKTIRFCWEEGSTAFKTSLGHDLGPMFAKEGRSVYDAIHEVTSDPQLQAVLACHAVLYGTSPKATSLMFHSQVVGSYYESACVWRKGGRHWIQIFHAALEEARVDIFCGQAVSEIVLDDQGHCHGVRLENNQVLVNRHCICTVHPKVLRRLLPDSVFRPAYRRRIDEMHETASAFVLFGRGDVPLVSGNIILIDDPDSIYTWQDRPLEERPLFISAPEGEDGRSIICPATLADIPNQEGHERFQRPTSYKEWKQNMADRLMGRLNVYAGDVIRDFELLDTASPLTFRDWAGSPEGGIYGVQHRQDDMPLLPQTRVPGLYLSGQAVVAPGVLGALCAGFLTESCVA